MSIWLKKRLAIWVGVSLCGALVWNVGALRAQESVQNKQALRAAPEILVQIRPTPSILKSMLKSRPVLSCGVANIGEGGKPVWVVSLGKEKPNQSNVLEFWQRQNRRPFRLLRRLDIPVEAGTSLSSQEGGNSVALRWLVPSQRRGPVVVLTSSDNVVIHVFEKGWSDTKPNIRKFDAFQIDNIDNYRFDSVDEKGFLSGYAFAYRHATSADGPFGESHTLRWEVGQGWKEAQ